MSETKEYLKSWMMPVTASLSGWVVECGWCCACGGREVREEGRRGGWWCLTASPSDAWLGNALHIYGKPIEVVVVMVMVVVVMVMMVIA